MFKCKMRRNCVQLIFRQNFICLGNQVAKHPSWFIICPLFLTILLATGIQRIQRAPVTGHLVTGETKELYKDKIYLEKTFPVVTSSNFDPSRATTSGRYGSAIVTDKNDGSVLRKEIFQEVKQLNLLIRNITIRWKEKLLKYENLCVKKNGVCLKNRILTLGEKIEEFQDGSLSLTYPLNFSMRYDDVESSVMSLGDVQVDKDNYIKSAKALRLIYYLSSSKDERRDAKAQLWEDIFLQTLSNVSFKYINVYMYMSRSIQKDMEERVRKAYIYFPIAFFLMLSFSLVTCSLPDWHRSKPWIGLITMMSCGMSMASGFGIVTYCGVLFHSLSSIVPFLILGIGMDDTFVMLSAWMRTNTEKSVVDRLSETYSEAGLSITLTSLTNFIAFLLGRILSPFESLKAFCASMCACIAFDYLYQITFVGAILVLYGRCEERRLHSLTFCPLAKPDKLHIEQQPNMITRISRSVFGENVWTRIGESFTRWYMKLLVLLIYGVYLSTSLWATS